MANKVIICPRCKNEARASRTYTGMFVCDCLGFLEDVSVLSDVVMLDLQIQRLNTVEEVMVVGTSLDNAASNRGLAGSCFNNGCLYKVSKDNEVLYLVWINSNKLIPSGAYFGKKKNGKPNKEDIQNFKKVTKYLIDKAILDYKTFESVDDSHSLLYLEKD